MQITRMDNFV